jgi:uncharacterized membrane protein
MRLHWIPGIACMALACAGEARRPSDSASAVPDSTDPDVITEADTTGPEPVDPSFRLIGTEPFWGLFIDSTGLRFTTPDDTAGQRFGFTRAVLAGDSLRWNSVGDAGEIEAVVVPATCSDGMSDKVWPYRARVVVGRTTYEGCAEKRDG